MRPRRTLHRTEKLYCFIMKMAAVIFILHRSLTINGQNPRLSTSSLTIPSIGNHPPAYRLMASACISPATGLADVVDSTYMSASSVKTDSGDVHQTSGPQSTQKGMKNGLFFT